MYNFLPKQYKNTKNLDINHNYLSKQFSNYKSILSKIEKIILENDFTLGKKVNEFEYKVKKMLKTKYVVSVGSGTDALMLSLKILGIKEGDEVITTPYTFYATIGAIVSAGAKPVFVDVKDDYNIDENKIEKKINNKTKAILPVHWSGKICEMEKLKKISKKYSIPIIEDACHAILAKYKGTFAGTFGDFGCFSMHPLKNLNVWGDGGFVVLKNKKHYKKMILMRNHGLISRNKTLVFGYNSRLDTIQAVVAIESLKKLSFITKKRIKNSIYLDKNLNKFKDILLKKRDKKLKEVFHLYEFRVRNKLLRNRVVKNLIKNGIDAKVHYPIPMHLQPAAKYLNYKKGDFPVAEKIAETTISLPVHEFVKLRDLDKIISSIGKILE
ncbi:MAG: pyridoxal-5'-phosphate-dependent protein [Acidimicrobiaceae bacterium]|nr:pyridoxal-5'-phosphate-dependent protein [Acidimicrobiaceae bacterium]|tara:strand:- start:1406 stop:2554 length:1149 start_codon:yes stop_codon:yes gene_type:complete